MRRPFRWFLVGAGVLAGCGPSVTEYCAAGSPECSSADAAVGDAVPDDRIEAEVVVAALDGGLEAEVAPSSCDPTKSPHDEPCVVDTAFGVFVSPAGSDTDPGSKSAPVRTIGRAMDLAKAAGKRVYVCAGSYPEQLVVGSSRDGVNVYGALDCATWTYGAANKVRVAPAQSGYALEIQGVQTGVTFEDLEFDAQNAPAVVPGASSVAVFVSSSQRLRFDRVAMLAGHGTDGAPAGSTIATNWFGTPPAYAELNGNNAEDAGGARSKPCTCADQSQTSGGAGGGPMNIPSPGAGTPGYSDAGAGAGGMNAIVCGSGGSPPANGADAPAPVADIPSTSLGACSASGWLPGVGATGGDGKPGQGGGGGGNGRLSTGSGGGGACGGCGGAGGMGGQGGGASIALLSFQSSLTLVGCSLTANAAGSGGAGGRGEAGQAGGSPGMPTGSGVGSGCTGGAGGAGAGGNGGQGGPGGSSVGIAYMGAPPTVDGVVFTQASSVSGISVGGAGAGGAGGLRGASAPNSTGLAGAVGAPGQAGLAAAVGAVP